METMYKINLCLIFPLFFVAVAFSQESTLKQTIYFDHDDYIIQQLDSQVLKTFCDELKQLNATDIRVNAHTDENGSNEYNMVLSGKRSAAILKFFIENDIDISDIITSNHGEFNPSYSNTTEYGKQRNRRVEIQATIRLEKELKVKTTTITDLHQVLHSRAQKTKIDPRKDNVIEGKKGTIIRIPANAFICSSGEKARGLVTISLQEVLSYGDMILNNITTTADDDMLETGGMIYITATSKQGSLELKEDKQITIMLPTGSLEENMKLFRGQRDREGNINWYLSMQSEVEWYWNSSWGWLERIGTFKRPGFMRRLITSITGRFGSIENMTWISKREMNKMKKTFDRKYDNLNLKRMKAKAKEETKYYVLNSRNFGWINCDRFSKYPPQKLITFDIDVRPSISTSVMIAFKDVRSMMRALPSYTTGQYYIQNIPYGEDVTIICLKYEHGVPSLAIHEAMTSKQGVTNLVFKQLTIAELKKALKELKTTGS